MKLRQVLLESVSFSIDCNPHVLNYESFGDYMARTDHNWVTGEAKLRCIRDQALYVIFWYPRTPVAFYDLAGPDLEELLDHEVEDEKK